MGDTITTVLFNSLLLMQW